MQCRLVASNATAIRVSQMTTVASHSAQSGPIVSYSESIPGAPLEEILYTNELKQRPSRPHNDKLFHDAIRHMIHRWASEPQSVLQSLADTILDVMHCDSAGISLIHEDRTRFYWPAIAGVWSEHVGGGTPLNFGPCGDVLAAQLPLHMGQIHKRYTYFTPVAWVREVLLVPFQVNGVITGTIWAVIHEPPNDHRSKSRVPVEYDEQDLYLLESLGELATAAYRVWTRPTSPKRRGQ
jgi:hypothetical protein